VARRRSTGVVVLDCGHRRLCDGQVNGAAYVLHKYDVEDD